MQASSPEALERSFEAARERVREERRRTEDERAALTAFARRVRSLPTESVSAGSGPATAATVTARTAATAGPAGGLEDVRTAYEETLMSVPHYEAEYGDTYVRSVAEEFGPDLAAAVVERSVLDERTKRALLSAAAEARAAREALEEALDVEADSLAAARSDLRPVVAEVSDLATAPLAALTFEALDAHRARLDVLSARCDEVAARRQDTLCEQRHSLWLPVDGPDVPTYAYRALEANYPVLAAATEVAAAVADARSRVERAMGYCH